MSLWKPSPKVSAVAVGALAGLLFGFMQSGHIRCGDGLVYWLNRQGDDALLWASLGAILVACVINASHLFGGEHGRA